MATTTTASASVPLLPKAETKTKDMQEPASGLLAENQEQQSAPSTSPVHCQKHAATPHVDEYLSSANTRARLHELRGVLKSVLDDERCCSTCAISAAARTLATYVDDVGTYVKETTKKNGGWTREKKRSVYAEITGLEKEVERSLKKGREESEVGKGKGWWSWLWGR